MQLTVHKKTRSADPKFYYFLRLAELRLQRSPYVRQSLGISHLQSRKTSGGATSGPRAFTNLLWDTTTSNFALGCTVRIRARSDSLSNHIGDSLLEERNCDPARPICVLCDWHGVRKFLLEALLCPNSGSNACPLSRALLNLPPLSLDLPPPTR
jgi:hypothetical protein